MVLNQKGTLSQLLNQIRSQVHTVRYPSRMTLLLRTPESLLYPPDNFQNLLRAMPGCCGDTQRRYLHSLPLHSVTRVGTYIVDTEKATKIFIINNICQIYMIDYCRESR